MTPEPTNGDTGDTTSVSERVEPIVKWLFLSILVLLLMLIGMDRADKSDSNIFQVIAGLVSAFSGALLMRIQPRKGPTTNGGNGGTPAPTASPLPSPKPTVASPTLPPPATSAPPGPTNLVTPAAPRATPHE